MNKNTVIVIVLVVLVLVTLVQAVQLVSLKSKLSSGQLKVAGSSQNVVSQQGGQQGSPNVPSSIQNLPQMVGGC